MSPRVILYLGPSKHIICAKTKLFLLLAVGNITSPEGIEGTV